MTSKNPQQKPTIIPIVRASQVSSHVVYDELKNIINFYEKNPDRLNKLIRSFTGNKK